MRTKDLNIITFHFVIYIKCLLRKFMSPSLADSVQGVNYSFFMDNKINRCIGKFDGTNFHRRKFTMQMALEKRDL